MFMGVFTEEYLKNKLIESRKRSVIIKPYENKGRILTFDFKSINMMKTIGAVLYQKVNGFDKIVKGYEERTLDGLANDGFLCESLYEYSSMFGEVNFLRKHHSIRPNWKGGKFHKQLEKVLETNDPKRSLSILTPMIGPETSIYRIITNSDESSSSKDYSKDLRIINSVFKDWSQEVFNVLFEFWISYFKKSGRKDLMELFEFPY
ncbi:MAG: hypothetical protein ACTSW7_04050 [Candidatus Thorarchaeota archaeon]